MSDDTQKIQEQMDEWRTKLDELRVQGGLLKMEFRDKKDEVCDQIEAAYSEAKQKFDEMKDAGEAEADKLGAGFKAAWSAFKQAYDGATDS